MAEIVYILCALMSIACAVLLTKSYLKSYNRLLLWSAISFGFLALNNSILFVDLVLLPDMNFQGLFIRNFLGAIAGSVLVYGLIWELT